MEIKNTTQTGGSKMENLHGEEISLSIKEIDAVWAFHQCNDAPDDQEGDRLAWCQPEDLISRGFSKHQAAGLFSSLLEKKAIQLYEERNKSEGGDLFVFCWDIVSEKKNGTY
tara:strand:- start:289 stop:624 length:336 start_codon:yes stop_codon:yes gene_type:complete